MKTSAPAWFRRRAFRAPVAWRYQTEPSGLDRVAASRVIPADRRQSVPLSLRGARGGRRTSRHIERDDVRRIRQVTRTERLRAPRPERYVIRREPAHHPGRDHRIGARAARHRPHLQADRPSVLLEEDLGQQTSHGTMLANEEHRSLLGCDGLLRTDPAGNDTKAEHQEGDRLVPSDHGYSFSVATVRWCLTNTAVPQRYQYMRLARAARQSLPGADRTK